MPSSIRAVPRPRSRFLPKSGGIVGVIFPVIRTALIQPDMWKGLTTFKALVENS